jgi:chondroitin AC lyase
MKRFIIALSVLIVISFSPCESLPVPGKQKPEEDFPENLDIYLLIGQSNMAGRAVIEEHDKDSIDRVFLYKGIDSQSWEKAANPLNKYSSIRKSLSMQRLGPGYTFARDMAAFSPEKKIGLVVNAKGGTSIDLWEPGSEFYNEAIRRTKDALKYGKLKGVIWHQGESDASSHQAYMDKLLKLIQGLRFDFDIPDLPFIAGQISNDKPHREEFNTMILDLPSRMENTAVVTTENIATTDSTHFNSESQRLLGKRYAVAMIKLISDDFKIIRERVIAELMKSATDSSMVATILQKMNEDGSFQGINYDDLSRKAGFPQRRHTDHLVYLATAYQKKDAPYYNDKSLKEAIINGLNFWIDNDFVGDNWHNNQISTPSNLVNLMLLVGEELPAELVGKTQPLIGRARLEPVEGVFYGARPGGDRIMIVGFVAKNALFMGDREKFDEAIKIIEGEIKFSTGERGMQHDYSFHHRHDRVNNTTSYGYGKYANAFGEWSYYVANTKYEFSKEKINHLVDYYLDGICKQLVYGIYEDVCVKNRSISHRQSGFNPKGTLEIERLLFSTDYRKDELEEILKLRMGEASPSKSFSKFFWQTEHFVFQRPNFYTTVRLFSTRNRNMEQPYNGPGITTHHRADGTNYLMLTGDEYHNIWAVYDWQKISGTTIMQKPELPGPDEIQKDGLTDFVGAVSDGLYGAVAFDFKSPHDNLEAKKSWFFFDDEYVCLGSGIHSRPNLPVYTTINQVLLRGDVSVKQNSKIQKLPNGNRDLDGVKWVHHDRIGYILTEPATINISNQAEQGRWSDITDQKNISDDIVTEDVFLLGFNHGNSPNTASYQYIVVPDVSEQELRETAGNNRNIDIISNTPIIQAVKNNKSGICQLVFYKAGELEISKNRTFKMDSQGMAMLKMEGKRIKELTVSDPSRKLSTISVTIPGIYNVNADSFTAYPDKSKNNTSILVDLPRGVYAGKSVTVKLMN